jgi:hypothetical protein
VRRQKAPDLALLARRRRDVDESPRQLEKVHKSTSVNRQP